MIHDDDIDRRFDAIVEEERRRYVGRRRAPEPEPAGEVCEEPQIHDRLERMAAQEARFPSPAGPGCCRWCGNQLPADHSGGAR